GQEGRAKQVLENFVKTYRNPAYTCAASDAEGIQEEVFQQKRVELWGEGLMWFDYMRLNKGVNRLNAMAPNAFRFDMPAGSPQFIYCIPNGEITANKQISDADNNPSSSRPTPVPNN
ncbi:MAG: RagB/SusD family nutrient uptake outer membrane protein, partial [Muribaculaceae bacterium]